MCERGRALSVFATIHLLYVFLLTGHIIEYLYCKNHCHTPKKYCNQHIIWYNGHNSEEAV